MYSSSELIFDLLNLKVECGKPEVVGVTKEIKIVCDCSNFLGFIQLVAMILPNWVLRLVIVMGCDK